ncbi:hypothetical protein [Litorisediminicola beolgyonensis]|uniref:Uncharacterized protein n=1 Tax=Litorisediminicola beolgyonensis TaxID=1173614 RepID=A0ABW3ZMR1_9RHOB
MTRLILTAALALGLAGAAAAQTQGPTSPIFSTKGGSAVPGETFEGQWFTTQDGCTYSRTKAPGYPTRWVLILNPHHVGQKPAHRGCKVML